MLILTGILVFCVMALLPQNVQMENTCDVSDANQRHDCGWVGITRDECENKTSVDGHCCYDDSVPDVPYCFHNFSLELSCSKEAITPEDRVDCGWYGITSEQCENNHCCYDESEEGVPWCFHSAYTKLVCSKDVIIPENRVECGWFGITREQCENKRCCYDGSEEDVPWCFYGVPLS